jgi:hypothetical protein
VLSEQGFLLSGGMPDRGDAECLAIAHLPCAVSIDATGRALRTARSFGNRLNSVGTVIHDYDFYESTLGTSDLRLAKFEEILNRWKNTVNVEHKLLSTAIREEQASSNERMCANFSMRKCIDGSRIGRKFLSRLRDVYWDTNTASRFAEVIRCLP